MKTVWAIIIGMCLVAGLFPAAMSGQVLPFRLYTTKDGLLRYRITGISQDRSG